MCGRNKMSKLYWISESTKMVYCSPNTIEVYMLSAFSKPGRWYPTGYKHEYYIGKPLSFNEVVNQIEDPGYLVKCLQAGECPYG